MESVPQCFSGFLSKVLHVSQFTGCRIITVDSKPGAVEWYRKKGFTLAQVKPRDDTIPLYMDFHRFVSQEEQRVL